MQSRLDTLIDCLRHEDSDVYAVGRSGNGIRTSQAVPAAMWAFVRYWKAPEECVVRAVNFGGDTDTIGAMAGTLAGALHGRSWIPARWYDHIENGEHGRDALVEAARGLARLE
ncbi:MAG: ADP-ribosylglycohydrolase family protein [Pirellulales bacterium]|nr:ADP-ribosylglycohydrolase family protein [Pirellulales bacterium]